MEQQSHQRWSPRLAGLPHPVTAHAFIEAFLAEALPTDAASRAFQLVGTSYAVLAMTDPERAAQPFVEGPDRLERQLTAVLEQAQREDTVDRQRDAAAEPLPCCPSVTAWAPASWSAGAVRTRPRASCEPTSTSSSNPLPAPYQARIPQQAVPDVPPGKSRVVRR
ncbi:hypothetical protein [Streptomyces afghaniensis]|uniref:hypothetical protein n=1 Tax=Streptomyces afghaniensis TaxID=66865 RepID=UPI0027D7EED8|nr:hypothetical protein [Streptomyces afghaniensis]